MIVTYVVAAHLLFLVELRSKLVDTRAIVGRVTTESDVQVLQESVATSEEGLGTVGVGIDTWLTVENDNSVGEIGCHDEIVLNDESSFLGVHDETLNDTRGNDTLLGVKVGRGLINQVNICRHAESQHDSDTLQFTTGQVLDFLVDKVLELEGLDDVGLELRVQESLLNLLEEKLANGAVELGCDCLGLHADAHIGDGSLAVGLEGTSQKTTESGLASTVLSHHDDDLGVGELTSVNAEPEVAELLLHLRILKGTGLVNGEFVGSFGNSESERLFTETQVLRGDVAIQEDVDTFSDGVRHGDDTINGRFTVEDADIVGEIV